MHKLLLASAAGLLLAGVSGSAIAATAEDCQAKFQAADINKDGVLKADEVTIFTDALTKASVTLKEPNTISKEEFASACEKDTFASVQIPAADSSQTASSSSGATSNTTMTATTADQSADQTQTKTESTDQTASTSTTTQPSATDSTAQSTTGDQTAATAPASGESTTATQALAAPSGFLASKLIGSTVYTKDDQSIGDVNDVIISSEASQPDGIIVGVGGFLGMGEKDVLMDMSKLSFVPTDGGGAKIVIDTTKADLESMPAYQQAPAAATQQ